MNVYASEALSELIERRLLDRHRALESEFETQNAIYEDLSQSERWGDALDRCHELRLRMDEINIALTYCTEAFSLLHTRITDDGHQ